jgi:Flp pilus assembly protein TadG
MKRVLSIGNVVSSTGGHAILEFALVLPLICLLGFAGIELSRALNTLEVATALSKEMASIAYRDCVADPVTVSGQVRQANDQQKFSQQQCLQDVRQDLNSRIRTIAPDAEFVISIYTYDSVNGYLQPAYTAQGNPNTNIFQYNQYKFTVNRFSSNPSGTLAQALREYDVLVIAEVYLPFESYLGRALPTFTFNPGVIYASTIL